MVCKARNISSDVRKILHIHRFVDDFPVYSMVVSMYSMVFPYIFPWFINQHGDEARAQDSCGEALPAADGGDLVESNRKSKTLKWRLCKGHVIVH